MAKNTVKETKKSTTEKKIDSGLSIAQQITDLETLMQKIESGELDIDTSISALKEATEKASALKAELASVELSVSEISIDNSDAK